MLPPHVSDGPRPAAGREVRSKIDLGSAPPFRKRACRQKGGTGGSWSGRFSLASQSFTDRAGAVVNRIVTVASQGMGWLDRAKVRDECPPYTCALGDPAGCAYIAHHPSRNPRLTKSESSAPDTPDGPFRRSRPLRSSRSSTPCHRAVCRRGPRFPASHARCDR